MHFLVPFIVFDVFVTVIVLVAVLKLRGRFFAMAIAARTGTANPAQLQAMLTFAREQTPRIAEYLRANYSGVPEQLPSVLTALLDELERAAKEQNVPLDRAGIKPMLASALDMYRIGNRRERGEAMLKVA